MKLQKWGPWLVFIAAMLWATDAPFRVHLTKEFSSSFIVLAEHFIDVIIILPILWWKRDEIKQLGKKEWLAVSIIAIGSSALASVMFTKAFSYVNPSVAIVCKFSSPSPNKSCGFSRSSFFFGRNRPKTRNLSMPNDSLQK